MKRIPFLIIMALAMVSCDGKKEAPQEEAVKTEEETTIEQLADPLKNKGVGPIKQVELGPIDQSMAEEGKKIYETYCIACHKLDERFIGPPLNEVTARRSPEWIMNMIMNPDVMVKEDPIAQELLKEYIAPMANQNISEDQARKILEYFRTLRDTPKVD